MRICQLLIDTNKCDRCKHDKKSDSFVFSVRKIYDKLKADDLIDEFSDTVLKFFEMIDLSSIEVELYILLLMYDDIEALPYSLFIFLIKLINHLLEAFQVISRTKCSHIVFPSLYTNS